MNRTHTNNSQRECNAVFLRGYLGKAPVLDYTDDGVAFAVVDLATHAPAGPRGKRRTIWHRLVFWGRRAEYASLDYRKGDCIDLQGQLTSRRFERRGELRTVVEVVVTRSKRLGGPRPRVAQLTLDDAR